MIYQDFLNYSNYFGSIDNYNNLNINDISYKGEFSYQALLSSVLMARQKSFPFVVLMNNITKLSADIQKYIDKFPEKFDIVYLSPKEDNIVDSLYFDDVSNKIIFDLMYVINNSIYERVIKHIYRNKCLNIHLLNLKCLCFCSNKKLYV